MADTYELDVAIERGDDCVCVTPDRPSMTGPA
jgi:hypothetical protein